MPVTGLWSRPAAVRPLDSALTAQPPRLGDWLAAQGPAERRALWGRLDSQLLLGERVVVHGVANDWAQVSAPQQPSAKGEQGYPGFIPAHHLCLATPAVTAARVVVTRPVTAMFDAPDGNVAIADVSFATVLPVADRVADRVGVRLPDGSVGWVLSSHVEAVRSGGALPSGEELIEAGRQFLGVAYLAGGVHGLSVDCSGLIHALYRRFGVAVPRDAADQLAAGTEVAVEEARFGDLMFFTEPDTGAIYHVGICLGWPRMLHASQTDWAVIDTPLTQRRRDHLTHVRRLHSGAGLSFPPPQAGPLSARTGP